MKPLLKRARRGFTLIELSIAIMMGMATASILMVLFNQQLAFLKIFRAQNFLTEEAPIVSVYVSRLVGKADRFRLHDSVADALSGQNPRLTDSPVVVLNFRQPDGSMRATILSFEKNRAPGPALYYYVVPATGVLGDPQWAVTKSPKDVVFRMEQGVLRMILTGPNDEEITYSGTMQQ
jgi:prepilin-type N-terminal cleavage/methylation domain-containing protein